MIFVDAPSNRQRDLRNAKQRRYRENFKAGFRSFKVAADPTVVRDFLVEQGVIVPDQEPETLGACMEIFFQRWEAGAVELG